MATGVDNSARLEYLWSIAHHVYSTSPELSAFYSQRFFAFSDSLEVPLSENLLSQFCTKCGSLFVPGVNCKVQVKHNQKKRTKNFSNLKKKLKGEDNIKRVEKLFPANYTKKAITKSLTPPSKTSRITKNAITYTCQKCLRVTQFDGTDRTHLSTVTPKTPINYFQDTSSELSTPTNLNSPLADKSTIQKRHLDSPTPKPIVNNTMTNNNMSNNNMTNSPTINSAKKKKGKKMGLQKLLSQSKEKEKTSLNLNDFLSSLN
ncbi:hypothetical protein K7432_014436 [Basidiobolus ranarum]|uniref:Uncharacterized protein n=1 Tax=Basidiobolus ranarum TaxID=34480 RepID=A0ABR2VPN4_9FUNG